MKKTAFLLIVIFLSLNTLIFTAGSGNQEIDKILTQADTLYNQSNFKDALTLYLNALELLKKEKKPDQIQTANVYNAAGLCCYYLADYKQSITYYLSALPLYEKNKNSYYTVINNLTLSYWGAADYLNYISYSKLLLSEYRNKNNYEGIVSAYVNIATAYYYNSDFDLSMTEYKNALQYTDKLTNDFYKMYIFNGLGNLYLSFSNFDEAYIYFEKSYPICVSQKNTDLTVSNLFGMGDLMYIWGNYDKALFYYEQTYSMIIAGSNYDSLIRLLDKYARIYQAKKDFENAVYYFDFSYKTAAEIKNIYYQITALNSMGAAYFEWLKFDDALKYYNEALTMSEKNNIPYQLNRIYIHLGGYYHLKTEYDKAYQYYLKGLDLSRKSKNIMDEIVCLGNIAKMFFEKKDYDNAIKFFNQSIDLIEQIRLTAKGEQRKDFLDTQIQHYRNLISAYIYNDNIESAFDMSEKARAKYLIDKMTDRIMITDFKFSGIKNYKNKLKDDQLIINYTNIEMPEFYFFLCDNKDINCYVSNFYDFNEEIFKLCREQINSNYYSLRGLKKINSDYDKDSKMTDNNGIERFEMIINYYRYLLSNPGRSGKETENLKYISQKLCELLINPAFDKIKDKKELIIIPDGILSFVPFETLILPDGRYLIEAVDIKYTQSLTVNELTEKRSYSDKRKKIIAFGGAQYEEKTETEKRGSNTIKESYELNKLYSEVASKIENKKNLKEAYEKLGLTGWQNIPGTLIEVQSIYGIFKDANIISGINASEETVKKISNNKELAGYKIIHFASHGLVVPEIPELSALILSQSSEDKKEDGYLTMNEIMSLDIKADFVNLSACETGLGKIYGGEGVVGLTQSFLIAGANGLSVSLWQVADQSTMEFMTGFYSLIAVKNISYDKAINEMKRKFISDGKYKDPFFWACFVYYGR